MLCFSKENSIALKRTVYFCFGVTYLVADRCFPLNARQLSPKRYKSAGALVALCANSRFNLEFLMKTRISGEPTVDVKEYPFANSLVFRYIISLHKAVGFGLQNPHNCKP